MRQFDPNQTLDQIHDRKQLNHDRLEKLANQFSTSTQVRRSLVLKCLSVNQTRSTSPHNLTLIRLAAPDEAKDLAQLLQLEAWAHEYLR